MVRVKVSQEYLRHIGGIDRQPGHAGRQAPSTVEQELLRSRKNQRADTQPLRIERRTASRPKQNNLETGAVHRRDLFTQIGRG